MDKLTREEVLHVAELGRINLKEEEIDDYSYKLKSLLNEIDKITNIDLEDDILIAPSTNECVLSSDEALEFNDKEGLLKNAPSRFDNFVEVVGVFDE